MIDQLTTDKLLILCGDPEKHEELLRLLANLEELVSKQVATLHELRKSIALAKLAPEFFQAHLKTHKITHHVRGHTHSMFYPWKGVALFINARDMDTGKLIEDCEYKLTDVPLILWPDDLRVPYERHLARTTKVMR